MARVRLVLGMLVALAGVVMGLVAVREGGMAEAKEQKQQANLTVLTPQLTARTAEAANRAIPGLVEEGDRITSDAAGVARIDWFDGSVTRVGPNTNVTLERMRAEAAARDVVLAVDVGRTWHRVTKAVGTEGGFTVRTSNAVAAVRGTRFGVGCQTSTSCVIAVVEGLVEVTDGNGHVEAVGPNSQVSVEGPSVSAPSPLVMDDFLRESIEADFRDGVAYPAGFTPVTAPPITAPRRTLRLGEQSG